MAASTTRAPRKTAAAKAAEAASAAEETPQATDTGDQGGENATAPDTAPLEPPASADEPAVESPKAPDAAPLEPPAAPEEPEPEERTYVFSTEAIPDAAHLVEVILDDATKAPPADLDAVFQPAPPYGTEMVCQLRLVERAFLGPHSNPIERLLMPEGALVAPHIAARVLERLRAQADARTGK
ncbi:hypothetical protein EV284_6492 [Streptomyces sp. BK022]|uniref:hypothetical protein n=1 Tax=Streptomyces sp. BK022 TaxID=2512123 RepID=UPI001029A49D|nr:hypothetical protein [Streptomyces sp. BK022]RZU28326.1 hypothetical protein EV284_6492 [Streptomyces sp. BK022]